MQNTSYNKYSNNPTFQDNIRFASKREAIRYSELKLLERVGEITDLQLQPEFVLLNSFERDGKTYRPIIYRADFCYYITDKKNQVMRLVVEDVKGFKTKEYLLKKKLLLAQNPLMRFIET